MKRVSVLGGILAVFGGLSAQGADRFENGYISFLLPTNWSCEREEETFVCLPGRVQGEQAAAVMVLTAKVASPDDTLANYQRHLQRDPPATGRGHILEPARIVTIGDTLWVQATLDGSEIPVYRTRYVATVSNDIAILVTFSAHRNVFDGLMGAAMQALQTLEVKAIRDPKR